jgi:hypothetical protein
MSMRRRLGDKTRFRLTGRDMYDRSKDGLGRHKKYPFGKKGHTQIMNSYSKLIPCMGARAFPSHFRPTSILDYRVDFFRIPVTEMPCS